MSRPLTFNYFTSPIITKNGRLQWFWRDAKIALITKSNVCLKMHGGLISRRLQSFNLSPKNTNIRNNVRRTGQGDKLTQVCLKMSVKTVCVSIIHIGIITHYAHGQTFPADVLSRLLCSWKSLVHRTPQYQWTFQPVCQSLVGQIQDDLAAQTDRARVDTAEQ